MVTVYRDHPVPMGPGSLREQPGIRQLSVVTDFSCSLETDLQELDKKFWSSEFPIPDN